MPSRKALAFQIMTDLAAIDLHDHSRSRVYPRDIRETIRLTPDAVANVFGNWTECIPVDTVAMKYHLVGMLVENQQAGDSYYVQLALNDDPAGNEYLGEARMNLGGLAGFFPSVPVPIRSRDIPANSPVYGRVKTAAGTNWLDISLVLIRHINVFLEVLPLEDFPW